MSVCVEYDVDDSIVGLVNVSGLLAVFKCVFYFCSEFFPVCFVVICV